MIQLGNCEALLSKSCSLACRNCNHASAITKPSFLEPESMERDLKLLSRVAHFHFHCLQGGEPLLNKKIVEFIAVQRASGVADRYGILTNGTELHRMTDEFWQACARQDFELRWSVYPIITDDYLNEMLAKARSFNVDIRPGRINAFKPMLTKHTDKGAHVFSICPWRTCWTCHDGMFYHCPIAALFPEQFPELFADGPPAHTVDGYPLETLTEEVIQGMIARTEPLKTCEICTGAVVGNWTQWGQTRNREEWIRTTTV